MYFPNGKLKRVGRQRKDGEFGVRVSLSKKKKKKNEEKFFFCKMQFRTKKGVFVVYRKI
jgi:hypothetical protein